MPAMRKIFACLLVTAMVLTQVPVSLRAAVASDEEQAGKASPQVQRVPYFSEPAIAPDRAEIAFVSGGDIWTAPLAGGEAHLLIANAAYDSRPRYSPDGKRLAFVSTRTGNGDIYVYTFATGETQRVTFEDSPEWLDAWSRDGRWLYFTSNSYDIAGMNDVFRVSSEGGTPMPVAGDRYAPEFFAAPGPDGTLAISARGNQAFGQWWRKGHSHIDESEIWLVKEGATPSYKLLSAAGGAKQVWPMWSADGKTLYYVSDRSGAQNFWSQSAAGGEARQMTKFRDGRVLWPVISYDGKTIVFERDFGVWKLDTASGQASAIPLTRRSAPPSPEPQHLTLTSQIQELALSPDGKKIAFVVHGEVFAASAKDGGNAKRVTYTVPPESNIVWSPDSKQIVYSSDRNGESQLFLYDFTNDTETQLTRSKLADSDEAFSPDGKSLAFVRDGRDVLVYDMASKEERLLSSSDIRRFPEPLVWSPDSKWLAFHSISNKDFSNVYVAPVAGGEAKPVTFLSNTFGGSIAWSTDGSYLLFVSAQRTENSMLSRVNLVPRTPKFREDQFKELFQERPPRGPGKAPGTGGGGAGNADTAAEKPAVQPVEVDFNDIRRRLQIINTGIDIDTVAISPDGKTLLLNASVANQQNLYTYPYDELSREPAVARQLTSTAENKSFAQFTPDGKEVYFLGGGRVQVITVESRQTKPINVTAEMDVDFEKEKMAVFEQAWSIKRDTFYDPKFHGVDWNAVHDAYAPRIAGAATPDEMRRLLNLMVGELNASHSGVGGPFGGGGQGPASGRLGLRFDRTEYETNGRLHITEVIALSPAAVMGIKPGEYLLAVEGKLIGSHTALGELLAYTSGKRTELTVATSADGTGKRNVALMPVTINAEKQLLYRQWVEERRAYVEKVSGGRLGYAHMPDMGQGSLAQLYVDLDVENHGRDGVVIDIRNNNGGFVNVYAIDVLARVPYLHMTFRGRNAAAPARSTLGQRALELPTALVVNQHSLSDAEDFTEGYRALKLGKVIGEPTAGWIIYTGGRQLLDGSTIRTPMIRITDNSGQTMEMNPRQVDVPVTRPIGESYTGKDSQLDAAVAELLKQLPKKGVEKAGK